MLSEATRKILNTYGSKAVTKMQSQAARYSASGKMRDGFRYEVTNFGLAIYGVNYLRWAETGRGKTRDGAKRGKPSLKEMIFMWLKAKGIPLWRDRKGRFIGRETMAFVIARKIHREGTWLFRKKKRRDIFSNVVTDESIQKMINDLQGQYITRTTSDLISQFRLTLYQNKGNEI